MRRESIFKHSKGQGVVEFALVIPILFLFIFGTIDFGRVAYNKTLVNQYTKEISRRVSIGKSVDSIASEIADMAQPLTGVVTTSVSDGTDDQGNPCTVITFVPSSGYTMTSYITPRYVNTLTKGQTMRIYVKYKVDYITPVSNIFGNTVELKDFYYTSIEVAPS